MTQNSSLGERPSPEKGPDPFLAGRDAMRRILQTISWLSLAAVVLPALLFLYGSVELTAVKSTLLVATIAWFIATPMWMGKEPATSS